MATMMSKLYVDSSSPTTTTTTTKVYLPDLARDDDVFYYTSLKCHHPNILYVFPSTALHCYCYYYYYSYRPFIWMLLTRLHLKVPFVVDMVSFSKANNVLRYINFCPYLDHFLDCPTFRSFLKCWKKLTKNLKKLAKMRAALDTVEEIGKIF
jgi:hypothetical protein